MIEFWLQMIGGTAGTNGAEVYYCGECGAAVIEAPRSERNRATHTQWHTMLRDAFDRRPVS